MVMKKGENYNRPEKGAVITVQPIRDEEDIKLIKTQLNHTNYPQELGIFIVGINTNLRPVDLCNLKRSDVQGAYRSNNQLIIREQKTKKKRIVFLNKSCQRICNVILCTETKSPYLFHKPDGSKLITPNITAFVKKWCKMAQLEGNHGGHTLRKTWGYHQYRRFGAKLPDLMKCFNHSTQAQTLEYLCIADDDIIKLFSNEI